MKSRKINNLLNIKSCKNKIKNKNNSTRRENLSNNNKSLKNKQEKCEEEKNKIIIVPKIIYLFWHDNNLPFLVNECYKSIIKNNKDHQIILHNIESIPISIKEILSSKNLSRQQLSDLVRLYVLKDTGGVWLDISTFVTTNLTNIFNYNYNGIQGSCFYAECSKGFCGKNIIESSCICCSKNNKFMSDWYNEFVYALKIGCNNYKKMIIEYYPKETGLIYWLPYLTIHACFHNINSKNLENNIINFDINNINHFHKYRWNKKTQNFDNIEYIKNEFIHNIHKYKIIKLRSSERPYMENIFKDIDFIKKNLTILILTHYTERQKYVLEITLFYIKKNINSHINILICNDSYNKSDDVLKKSEKILNVLKDKYKFSWYNCDRGFTFNNKNYRFDNLKENNIYSNVGCNIINLILKCNTKYFLFIEHDWVFLKKINIMNILNTFDYYKINYIRFLCKSIKDGHDKYTKFIPEINMTSTSGFSNHPYISRTSFWLNKLIPILIEYKVGFVEEKIMKYIEKLDLNNNPPYNYLELQLFLYGKECDENDIIIKHLDGSNHYKNDKINCLTDEHLEDMLSYCLE
tara:strand:+ start:2159 stop:3889 length:1731 start_codon:yes stop_codon:yes gene_type:complete